MGFSCRCSIFCTNIGNGLFEAIDPTNVNRFTFVGASVTKQHFLFLLYSNKKVIFFLNYCFLETSFLKTYTSVCMRGQGKKS